MKAHLLVFLYGTLISATPSAAQVIEIDSTGTAQIFAGPTMFNSDGAVPIQPTANHVPTLGDTRAFVVQAARSHGLDPALLEAVAWQESRWRMSAVSPRGARGIMQLMPATAAELGVRADDLADNIRGGALYLRRQLEQFGSVPLALAAYNAGPGAVRRYGGIPPYRETQNYVASIMGRWRPAAVPAASPITSVEVTTP